MTANMKVDISASSPCLWVEVGTDDFGMYFANMGADEQVSILAAMVKHMTPHKMQWDYIAIELEKPENTELRNKLKSIIECMVT